MFSSYIVNHCSLIDIHHSIYVNKYRHSQMNMTTFKEGGFSRLIKNKPKLNYQYLLSLYEQRKGKTLQPIKYRSSSNPVPNSITCPHCSAPYYYIYFNDGKKNSQLKCKICFNTFQIEKRFLKKTKYYCPYCSKALFT